MKQRWIFTETCLDIRKFTRDLKKTYVTSDNRWFGENNRSISKNTSLNLERFACFAGCPVSQWKPHADKGLYQLRVGSHRTRQRCFGPAATVRARPGQFCPVKTASNGAGGGAVLTGRNGPGRALPVANRAGTALTGAVRTGLQDWHRPADYQAAQTVCTYAVLIVPVKSWRCRGAERVAGEACLARSTACLLSYNWSSATVMCGRRQKLWWRYSRGVQTGRPFACVMKEAIAAGSMCQEIPQTRWT